MFLSDILTGATVQDKIVSILILAGMTLLTCGYLGTSPNCPSPFELPGDPCPTVDCEDDNGRGYVQLEYALIS